MTKTLIITNDFPPRAGGIQSYVHSFAMQLPAEDVVVLTSRWRGWEAFDAVQPFPVHRHSTKVLLPTPEVAKLATRLAREHGCTAVWFGAMAPLAALAKGLKRSTLITRAVASTHGHEVGWVAMPGGRQGIKELAKHLDAVTYISEYTRSRLAPVIGAKTELVRMPGGVDVEMFSPEVDGGPVRERLGLTGRPVVVCVSRLMPRKGQDTLIEALPRLRELVPGSALLIVGGGPSRERLQRLGERLGVAADVVFTGGIALEQLPQHYRAGDVFAMPCRTRLHGIDVEGLGLVYLEASASGLPVIAGNSGGAPDAVLGSVTGEVIDAGNLDALVETLARLLTDPQLAGRLGAAGREWVEREWTWASLATTLEGLLRG